MAFCKNCGTDIGESTFCPSCGTKQDSTVAENNIAPEITAPEYGSSETNVEDGRVTSTVDTTPPVYSAPVYSTSTSSMPETGGLMAFSIVNIVLGVIGCCCYGAGIITLIMGIIATVTVNQAKTAQSAEEAQQKLRTAKILNIVGVVIFALALIISLIASLVGGFNYSEWLSDLPMQ